MKSNLDGEIPEYSLRPKSRSGSGAATPWFLFILALAAAGGGGYLAFKEHEKSVAADARLNAATTGSSNAEARLKELTAKLDSIEAEKQSLMAAKDELAKNVQTKDEELAKLKGTYDELQDKLKSDIKSGDVSLTQSGGKLRVDLVDKVLFNSGESQISKRGETVLGKVGAILAAIPDKQIQVSGHTDQTPIGEKRSAQFASNWELSVARATNVVRFMQDKAGIPGERLMAAGYGEFHPVASNKSASGRARNRRIEILLTPSLAPQAVAKSKLKAEAQTKTANTEAKATSKRPK